MDMLENIYLSLNNIIHKCCVLKWGNIHHKDGNKSNNIIENLKGMTGAQHMSLHHKGEKKSEYWIQKIRESNTLHKRGKPWPIARRQAYERSRIKKEMV